MECKGVSCLQIPCCLVLLGGWIVLSAAGFVIFLKKIVT